MNHFFEQIYREAKVDRIKKFVNLTDEQKDEAAEFFKSHATGYDNYIDWQHPEKVYWSDFEKVFDLANNSKSKKKKDKFNYLKSENPLYELFNRDDVLIHGEDDNFIFVSPLSYEASVWMDSVECGGAGAQWCIGYEKSSDYWYDYLSKGYAFILAFRKDFLDIPKEELSNDLKYMIQINPFINDISKGMVWNQVDSDIVRIQPEYDINFNGYTISRSTIQQYAYKFWEEVGKYTPLGNTYCSTIVHDDEDKLRIPHYLSNLISNLPIYNDACRAMESLFGDKSIDMKSALLSEITDDINAYCEWNFRVNYLFSDNNIMDIVHSYNMDITDRLIDAISEKNNINIIIRNFIDRAKFKPAEIKDEIINGVSLFEYGPYKYKLSTPSIKPISNIDFLFEGEYFLLHKILIVDYDIFKKYNCYFYRIRSNVILRNIPENANLDSDYKYYLQDIGGLCDVNIKSISLSNTVNSEEIAIINCNIDNLDITATRINIYNSNIKSLTASPFSLELVDTNIYNITGGEDNIQFLTLSDSSMPLKNLYIPSVTLCGTSVKYTYSLKDTADYIKIFNKNLNRSITLKSYIPNTKSYYKYIVQYTNLGLDYQRAADLELLLA